MEHFVLRVDQLFQVAQLGFGRESLRGETELAIGIAGRGVAGITWKLTDQRPAILLRQVLDVAPVGPNLRGPRDQERIPPFLLRGGQDFKHDIVERAGPGDVGENPIHLRLQEERERVLVEARDQGLVDLFEFDPRHGSAPAQGTPGRRPAHR